MPFFARSYGRQLPPPQTRRSMAGQPPETMAADRVRVIRGALAGVTGRVICRADCDRWLVAADEPGLVLRIDPQLLEPIPPA